MSERDKERYGNVFWLSIHASVNSKTFSVSLAASVFVLRNPPQWQGTEVALLISESNIQQENGPFMAPH